MRKLRWQEAVGAAVIVAFAAGSALGDRQEPKKANKVQMTLVGAYEECDPGDVNDTTGGSVGLPACSPAVPSGGPCGIDAKGGGKVLAKAKNGDVDIKAKAKGITGCEGESVCVFASFQATADNCVNGADCTAITLTDFPVTLGGCQPVTKGKVNIKTTLNTEIPGAVNAADRPSITIKGVTLGLPAGTAGVSGKIFAGGLLVD